MKIWLRFWSGVKFMSNLDTRKIFQGRPVLPGSLEGEVLVTSVGFNAYACFYNSLHADAQRAECADSGNRDLSGKCLNGKIICLSNTTGSTSAGAVWQRIAKLGLAPKAMLFSQTIDSLAAAGLIIADLWAEERIVTIDRLGDEFLKTVTSGDCISILEDGTVIIK